MQQDPRQFDEPELEVDSLDEAAALWSECLREAGDDAEVHTAFERWRDQDPAHAEAFERVDTARAVVASVEDESEIMGLRNETLSRVAMQRVAAERAPRSYQPPRLYKTRRFNAVAAAFAVVVVGTLGALIYEPALRYSVYDRVVAVLTGTDIYRTGIGQRLMVTLDDGSALTLNTDSLVRVEYGEAIRNLKLEHGQALFKVARDQSRPFVVNADGHRVTALGTAFDVRKSGKAIEVTLIEGRVVVERTTASEPLDSESDGRQPAAREPSESEAISAPESWAEAAKPVENWSRTELEPGQQLVDAGDAMPIVRTTDVARVTSWREGRVIFDDDNLSVVVAEMNRYSRRHIVLGDRRLADLEVSGAFDTGKTDVFVEALVTYFPIKVVQQNNDSIVLAWNGG